MQRFILSICTALLLGVHDSRAQYAPPDPGGLEGIIVETYYVADANDAADTDGGTGLTAGSVTYRVFVDMRPGYKLLTVGGFTDHPITFATTTSFFNNEDRGEAWGHAINDIHLDKNTVAIDSWLSMGAGSDAHWGVLKTGDTDASIVGGTNNDGGSVGVPLLVNDIPAMGVPLTLADGLWSTSAPPTTNAVGTPPDLFDPGGSNSYSNDNFAWAVLGGIGSPDTTTNRILIGQFTTDGTFTFCLNLWLRIPDSLVCSDPNCHEILEFYGNLLPSDTAGTAISGDNKFTLPGLCFNSSALQVDCEGVPGGPAQPGTACDDGNDDTSNDVYDASCACLGEDCLGVLGGTALPGQPCDDGDPDTGGDIWQAGCTCEGTVGIHDINAPSVLMNVHPNPAKELLWIELSNLSGQHAVCELKNAFGQRVLTMDLGNLSGSWKGNIDVSGLGSGMYILEFRTGSEAHLERVVKF
ncbi:MAG: T9SS type A sorting domain-containing protein [Flavobacteriales bacterium]